MNQDSFQPIHNPYIVGNPVKDQKMFFGRQDDFNYILQKVTGSDKGGLIVLCGTRRSGKTSILFQIMNGRLGDEFFPVLIDMQAMTVENDRDFLIKLARGITDAIGGTDIDVEAELQADTPEGALMSFQMLIGKINDKLAGKKLVLLFDEYEIFESHIAKNLISTEVLNVLANWIEHKEGVFMLFTGSDKLEERTADYWERFLGRALHRRVSFLSRADALRLVNDPVAGDVLYDEGVPERIYELTAGQPFYTQVFCQALVDHLNEWRKNDIEEEDLQEVVHEIIENPLPQMIFAWNSLENIEKLALSIIAELNKEQITPVTAQDILDFAKSEKIGYRIDPNKLNETLERLFIHDHLDKDTVAETYKFRMDLWRRWLARMHSIWQVIDEVASAEDGLGEGIEIDSRRPSKMFIVTMGIVAIIAVGGAWGFFRGFQQEGVVAVPADSTVVSVATTPPGADVFLGTEWLGKSPIVRQAVEVRAAMLRVDLDGYKTVADTVRLAKDVPLDTSITLVQRTGGIRVTSEPEGAMIYLDGESTGRKTPGVLDGIPIIDRHRVSLRLAGFGAGGYSNLQVFEDSTIAIAHKFSKLTSQLAVVTEPSGAAVEVDGEAAGTTPTTIARLTHGAHEIVIRLAGYQTWQSTIEVPVKDNAIQVTLKKLPPGTLIVHLSPYGDVLINGALREAETEQFNAELEPGTYRLELRHPTYGNYVETVEIVSNQTKVVDHRFQ